MNRLPCACLALLALAAPAAAQASKPKPKPKADVVVQPGGDDVQERLQEALILAKPGQVIELGAGTFQLTLGLSLSVPRVTLRGQGPRKTILSFQKQEAGSEGLLLTGSGEVLEDLAVVGAKGDAIKAKGCQGITFRRVRAAWLGKPTAKNGGYGFYPVQCEDVLIEDCSARGASDAGIYVGQSKRVIVRRCRAELNVAGIEIENSRQVDVYANVATKNTGGILVFDLPNLPVQGGGEVRVFKNRVFANQTANFAPKGNIVALVPRGTGLLIMANRGVEIFENTVEEHATTNLAVLSYLATGLPLKDPKYDPFPRAIHVHHNTFGDCGQQPDGQLGALAKSVVKLPLPAVIWDGAVSPQAKGSPLALHDNGKAGFLNLDLIHLAQDPKTARPSRDLAPHTRTLKRLPPVVLKGAKKGGAK